MSSLAQRKAAQLRRRFDTGEPTITRHLGRSTWQGPESEALNAPLPIDLPAVENENDAPVTVRVLDAYQQGYQDGFDAGDLTPMQMLRARDVIYAVIFCLGTIAGGALVLWVMP